MACNIIERKYTDTYSGVQLSFLQENAKGEVSGFVRYENEYYVGSGTSNTFTMNGLACSLTSGNWVDFIAIVPGVMIDIEFDDGASTLNYTREVIEVIGGTFYMDSQLPAPYNTATFPSGAIAGMRISLNQAPDSVEFSFNLAPTSNPSSNSVIDGNENVFKIDEVGSLVSGTPSNMIQVGQYKSGGHIFDVTLTLESVGGVRGISRFYRIDYKFNQWAILQDGFEEPDFYPLSPYHSIKNYTENGNFDGVQEAASVATSGNLGGYDQSFTNGFNQYSLTSISHLDYLGNSIDGVDYSNESTFTAVINATDQNQTTSKFQIGLGWRPRDASRYKDKADRLGDVLKWNVPNTVFNHSTTPNTTVYQGLSVDGSRFDLTDVQFIVSATSVTVKAKVIPVNMVSFIESATDPIPVDDRRLTIHAALSNPTLDTNSSNKVHLKLYDEDVIDAPTLGVQHPKVIDQFLLDHAGNDITINTTSNTTTGDDLLYKSRFMLDRNTEYEGVRTRIFVKNDITLEEETLEEFYFDFSDTSSGVYLNGVHDYNKTFNRNFLLPITSDRKHVSLKRDDTLDTPTDYGMSLEYGFLSRIESWIANNGIPDYFFDQALPNNGKNQNWARFTDGDWQTFIAYYPRKNGVDDFQEYNLKTRPFNDDSNFTASVEYFLSDGTPITGIACDPQSPLVTCEVTINHTLGFTNPWFELTMREKDGPVIGFMSTEHDRDNVVSNVLQPTTGNSRLEISTTGNTSVIKCVINSLEISVNNVYLLPRVYTEEGLNDYKLYEDGTPKQYENGDFKEFE